MAKNDFQYDGWNSYNLQCGTITTLISPGDCTLQCDMWFWNHDSEFTKSTCHSVPVCEILSKSDHPRQKKMTSCRFSKWGISAILDCRDPIMGSLKSSCTTSYRSLIETTALEKIAFLHLATDRQTDKRMDTIDA